MDIRVFGVDVDKMTRCAHYHDNVDIIAIQFYCCKAYYSCHRCHEKLANHPIDVWPKDKFHERAILCGSCRHQLTIAEYLRCDSVCPYCNAMFNEGCELHRHLYFEV